MNVTATLFGQMITFVIFVWFIKAYLWEPLTKAMDDRSNKIADGLAAAVCHHFQKETSSSTKSYSGWKAFVSDNPKKVK